MNLNELFSEKNLGLPVKVRMGNNEKGASVYMYGRYYGRGYDGESLTSDEDYYLIAMVTPQGSLVRGGSLYYELIEDVDDLKILEEYEKMTEIPYKPYLVQKDNKYYKTYEYKNEPLTFNHYPLKWFEENSFFDIDENIFGNALSTLFSMKFGKDYYFQKLISVCEAKPGPVVWHTTHISNLSVISPTQYDSEYSHYISPYPFSKEHYFDNLFKHFPVKINDSDFLVYFGNYSKRKIKLGKLQDGNFVPNNFDPIQDYEHRDEVKFNNPSYDFVSDFINAIIQYKLNNRKPDITQEDMDVILEQFGIRKDPKGQIKKLERKSAINQS